MSGLIDRLLRSPEPCVRLKVLRNVLGEDGGSRKIRRLQREIQRCARVKKLLSEREADGTLPYHAYTKWVGAHWVLATLADIGYPAGDKSLIPLREQVYGWLLSGHHERSIPSVEGRARSHASQEGNALLSMLTLGLADERTEELARRLVKWQWPDGGWNCDKKPEARNSSFMESLIPLRALSLHGAVTGNKASRKAAKRAAEVFLKRKLYKRQRDGRVIAEAFTRLHYPCYWHYDILFGLKVMAEAGLVGDPRCCEALDLLERKQLADGGYPAEGKYYRASAKAATGRSMVDWGVTSARRMNEFVTADALFVLKESGRLRV